MALLSAVSPIEIGCLRNGKKDDRNKDGRDKASNQPIPSSGRIRLIRAGYAANVKSPATCWGPPIRCSPSCPTGKRAKKPRSA